MADNQPAPDPTGPPADASTTPEIHPVQVNAARVIAAGTAAWVIALLALLIMWRWTHQHHHETWIWTCLVGSALGLLGLLLIARHRAAGRTA